MLRSGIVNPQILSLLARVRHTNTLVIADRGFPSWPGIETVDISLNDDLPTVLEVLEAIIPTSSFGMAWMAEEFLRENDEAAREAVEQCLQSVPLTFEPHAALKGRVPEVTGLIRTGDTIQYANIILESG